MPIRRITIDYTAQQPVNCRMCGYIGEHNATELLIIPPVEMAENAAVTAYAAVFTTDGKRIPSRTYLKSEELSLTLWQQLTQSPVLNVQLEAYDGDGELVAKSPMVYLALLPAARGAETEADYGSDGIAAEIAENTKLRHEHSNKTVLDKLGADGACLTYDGQPIKGGVSSTQGDWQQSDPAAADYIKNRTHYDVSGYSIEWDGKIGDRVSVLLAHTEEEGEICLVKIADDVSTASLLNVSSDDVQVSSNGEITAFSDYFEPIDKLFTAHANGSFYDAASYIVLVTGDSCDVSEIYTEIGADSVILSEGLWVFKSSHDFISKINVPDSTKQLDIKYIPDIAFGKIELEAHEGYSTIKVTDRNGKVTSTDIKDGTIGKTPVKGTDYWTATDKAEIVNETISALPKWNGGSY